MTSLPSGTPAAHHALIVGNWKMHGQISAAQDYVAELSGLCQRHPLPHVALAVCPAFPHLALMLALCKDLPVSIGGQDCHTAEHGAHTGDTSAAMLADLGCVYTIVGHSERRQHHGETDALIQAKARAAQAQGLIPIVCIGEMLAEREAGQTLAVLERQVRAAVPANALPENLVVAYEPVWAIGTGKVAQPEQVAEAHAHIRAVLRALDGDLADVKILYGGSVKPDNAAVLMATRDVDGALVGGASLNAADFYAIALAAEQAAVRRAA
jgi:triosephosphate isomerase (TIM)